MEAGIKLAKLYEANYPEYLHRVFAINGNTVWDNFQLSHEFVDNIQAIYESTAPCIRISIINHFWTVNFLAPKIVSILTTIMKPFVPEKTMSKIKIFGHDDKEWKAAILEHVNPEELPACYGGTRTDPDGNPNCATLASPYLLLGSSFSFKFLENVDQYWGKSSEILLFALQDWYYK